MLAAVGVATDQFTQTYRASRQSEQVLTGVRLSGRDVGGLEGPALQDAAAEAAEAALDRPLQLAAGPAQVSTTPRALGATPLPEASVRRVQAAGKDGTLTANLQARFAARRGEIDLAIGYRFAEDDALDQLLALAPQVERPSLPTRLDLEARKVLPAKLGSALLAYDSMSSVAIGLASGTDTIELVVQDKPPVTDPLSEVADDLEVGTVLGSFATPYTNNTTQTDRNHNLKVGATAVTGHVLMPGEVFSFNEVVGPRSAEAGYRYATGIAAGQLIDVLGGGICQVSSTLFGAAFFAGLDVVRARPHSRPSSYVDMGLDSTVAYPTIDMKIGNPYEFPVVLRMTVSQGKVRSEILGPRRPYQVAFERTIAEVKPYRTVWRDDDRLRLGAETTVQRGMRGFKMVRKRKMYQGGEVVKTESWDLTYPPTTEILRRGTNPQGEVPQEKPKPPLRDPEAKKTLMQ